MAAAPDGYTIAAVSAGPLACNPHLYAKLPYDTLRDVTDRMLNEGTVPTPSTPEEFTAYITSELKKWGQVINTAKIKIE